MIHIDRYREEENRIIIPNKKWIEDAISKTKDAKKDGHSHKVDENFYKEDTVRAALEKLFHHKCAYCESDMTGVSSWDVEHYRPKGRVAEREDHPGYYWLAYYWPNLFPSCTYCNQRRKDKPIYGDMRYAETGGKLDQFPLVDENKRAISPEDPIEYEEPLLLSPCEDSPEKHLKYEPTGEIQPLKDDLRGKSTINICHLNRRRLTITRRKKMKQAVLLVGKIQKHKKLGNIEAVEDFGQLLDKMANDEQRFAGAVRYIRDNPDLFGLD